MEQKKQFSEYVKQIKRSINYIACTVTSSKSMNFEDVKQELLIASWKAYQSYDPEKSKFTTYAVNRMKKAAINIYRRSFNKKNQNLDTVSWEDNYFVDNYQRNEYDLIDFNYDKQYYINQLNINLKYLAERSSMFANAYKLFQLILQGNSLVKCSEELELSIHYVTRLFREYIVILFQVIKKDKVTSKQVYNVWKAELKPKEANMAKKIKKVVKKEKTTTKGGLVAKKAFVEANFVKKGKSKSEAVQGLMEKYPEMSINYARTIVYSQMKDSDWAETEKSPKKKVSKKKEKKKSSKPVSKKSSKKSKKDEDEDEEDDDDEEELEDDDDEEEEDDEEDSDDEEDDDLDF